MCGATGEQNTIQGEQMAAYQQAREMMQEEYGHQQAIYGPMANQLGSIFALGPSQEGFAPAEKEAFETQIIEGTGQNYANAARAVNQQIAAQGGIPGMRSGAADQLKLNTALSSAQEKTREELGVTQANYAQGRANWQQAGTGLMDIAAGMNPLGYEQQATGAGSAASTTANQIAQEQNSWINAAIGAAGTIGGMATGAGINKWG